jgi:hypothetical protein
MLPAMGTTARMETLDEARAYVEKVHWQFAKTMPRWPHEYTVRRWRPDLADEWDAFADLIQREGTRKPWPPDSPNPKYRHAYLEIDGYQYWVMPPVINRADVDSPGAA